MKKYKLKVNENTYNIDILDIEDNIAEIVVNGVNYQVELDKKIQQTKTPKLVRSVVSPSTESETATIKTSSPHSPKGAGFIKSPLPGTIVSINVNVGDSVKIGDKLLVLEAMKMENNINSDKAGRILAIRVRPRDAVLEGDILIEIGD